jgi:NADP-dependent 3-hydroxy acid dehydrogenase YdfG
MDTKVIVITGASGGIGAALARYLGKQGHHLVLGARRQKELEQVAKQSGTRALAVVTDVTKRSNVEHLRDEALKQFGHIDVWVNNAGRGIGKKVLDLTEDDVNQMVDINLKSFLYGMQTIVPHFQQRDKGQLINVSSFLGRVPYVSFTSIYSAVKSALNSLTTCLRIDLKEAYPDIHVSLIMPGIVSTDFSRNAIGAQPAAAPERRAIKEEGQTAEEVAAIIASVIEKPVAEMYTKPELAKIVQLYYKDPAAFGQKSK